MRSSDSSHSNGATAMAVLLVEDCRANQLVAKRFLERRGHRVTLATTGPEALALHAAGQFDAILMDVDLPGMSGLQATGAIRDAEGMIGRRTPIIALTANVLPGDREACLEAGMDDYLAKPMRAPELYETLERWGEGVGA